MNQTGPRTDLAAKTVLYTMPGMDDVIVRRDEPYKNTDSGALTMDLYYPPSMSPDTLLPAVVLVFGYSDAGYPNVLGCKFKEMGMCISWAKLFAASGIVAILYTNQQPPEDAAAVMQFVQDNADRLGIDRSRIGLWSASGNAPLGLSMLMQPGREYLKCAVFCTGFMMDLDGRTGVADMQRTYRFSNPCEGRSADDVRSDVPMLMVRAGQDQFHGVNESLDNFLIQALRRDLPVTLVNHAGAPHGFELYLDDETTHEIVRQVLRFVQFHLSKE